MVIDRFNTAGELLREEAVRRHMVAPAFCSPPVDPGLRRAIRRFDAVTAMVSIRLDGRSEEEVLDDMVEGVIVASALRGMPAAEARLDLLRLVSSRLREETGAGPCSGEQGTAVRAVGRDGSSVRPENGRRRTVGRSTPSSAALAGRGSVALTIPNRAA